MQRIFKGAVRNPAGTITVTYANMAKDAVTGAEFTLSMGIEVITPAQLQIRVDRLTTVAAEAQARLAEAQTCLAEATALPPLPVTAPKPT